jgi:hypothetical protein
MESKESHENGLPIRFPEGKDTHLFPNPWPARNQQRRKLPALDSPQMHAMARFFASYKFAKGDMKKFSDYFGYKDQSGVSLSLKIYKEKQNGNCRQGHVDRLPDNTSSGDFSSPHSTPTQELNSFELAPSKTMMLPILERSSSSSLPGRRQARPNFPLTLRTSRGISHRPPSA